MIEVFLALGSNLGDRKQNITDALNSLDFITNKVISSFYEYPALLPEQPDDSWDIPFINAVMKGTTDLEPLALFTRIKEIEKNMGRPNNSPKWSPRIIDIDIIFYGDIIINNPLLTIPHPEMYKRKFVLEPLTEIAPNFIHPTLNKPIKDLIS